MKECSRNKLLVGLYEDAKESNPARPMCDVSGCVHPLRPQMRARGKVYAGSSVEAAVTEACSAAGIRKRHMKYGIAQIGTRDIEKGVTVWKPVLRKHWASRTLKEGEILRFRMLPQGGGGGGGKNPLRTILMVVVAVVAIAVSWGVASAPIFGAGGALAGMGSLAGGLAGLAVTTIGMVLVNAIAPVKPPSVAGLSSSRGSESQVYAISAGRNSINQWGRVPAPLGTGRFAAPKAASPYTQTIGEDQYLHELLCLGIGDMNISGLKIGNTPIEEFTDCEYEVYTYDPKNPRNSKYYPTGVYQEDLSVQLKKDIWNSRTTATCDKIEIDFSFQGLCYFNDQGNPTTTSVEFYIQYKKKNELKWTEVSAPSSVAAKNYTMSAYDFSGDYRDVAIVCHPVNGTYLRYDATTAPAGEILLGVVRLTKRSGVFKYYYGDREHEQVGYAHYKECIVNIVKGQQNNTSYTVSGLSVSVSSGKAELHVALGYASVGGQDGSISVSGGTLTKKGDTTGSLVVTYSGAQSRLLRKTYTIDVADRDQYDVRIKRNTADSTNDRVRDESYWSALRSITNDIPIHTDYPVMLLALQIKATGQLSGAVDTLTHSYQTKCLDYDKDTKTWVKRFTSNPASVYRYVLQNADAMARPQPDKVIDLPSLEEAHEYWDEKDWNYNFVCDSSVSVFERLQSICAAGLASPTMVDGKWAIIVDKERTNVVCAFTSANAWGWSFKRTQVRLPNAIHCSFISDVTWDTDMRVVATDEPVADQYIYETQQYEGVNSSNQVYYLARFHYADAKVRRRVISLRCYDEALLCTRGDLVECACPNVSPQGIQVGRVRKITKDAEGNVVSFTTDQTQTAEIGTRRFGVRIYNNAGAILHAEVKQEDRTQAKITLLIPQKMDIESGNKYAFGDYSEETFKAIVIGLQYNSDWTCDVTLQDYQPQIYGNLKEEIPEFTSIITRPIEDKWQIYNAPTIIKTTTDESVLLKMSDGTLIPRILVDYKHPNDVDPKAYFVNCEFSEAGKEQWSTAQRDVAMTESSVFISNVSELQLYDVRLKYTGASGETGPYVYARDIRVIGKTSLPPSVKGFTAAINSPLGILLKWDDLVVKDLAKYRITGDAQTETVDTQAIVQVVNKTGTLSFSIVGVDTGDRVSEIAMTSSVLVNKPYTPVSLETSTRTDGLYATWRDCASTFPIRGYTIKDVYTNETSNELKTQFVLSPRPAGDYVLQVRALDIFGNYGDTGSLTYSVLQPSAPLVSSTVQNGVVRIEWKAVLSSFPIKTYRVYAVDGTLVQNTNSTYYDIMAPTGTLEYRVQAEDSAGNLSVMGAVVLQITAPTAPSLTASLSDHRDGVVLSWNVPSSMLPITTYDVVRQWTVTNSSGVTETKEEDYGSTDSTTITVPPCSVGVQTYRVRAVDQAGNRSGWGFTEINVVAPSAAIITDVVVVDNNVQIYWLEPQKIFFAVAYYNFSLVEDGYAALVGRIDARFTSRFEKESGSFTYQICPVDVAGNIGTCNSVTAQVAQPPDYIFFDDYDSTLNGTKTNAVLDGMGSMHIPVLDESWNENNARIGTILSKNASDLTWSAKIGAGYTHFMSPSAPTGSYIETVDIGTMVPATMITVTFTQSILEGDPLRSCKIEISSDGVSWRTAADDATSCYGAGFRYVRYTVTVTGGILVIHSLNYRLDVKKLSDFGTKYCVATDNGEVFIDKTTTPELYGTWVDFNVAFTDVQSGPIVFCNEEGKTAYCSFVDTLSPKGFRAYVLDKNGNRVSGQVSWSAYGV